MKDEPFTRDFAIHYTESVKSGEVKPACGASSWEWATDIAEKVNCVDCLSKMGVVREQK
jgi:hypothetical protein